MNIKTGNIIKLKSEWMDEGDENLTFFSTEDYSVNNEPMDSVIATVLEQQHMAIVPTFRINIYMIKSVS